MLPQKETVENKHAKYSASGASRWLSCPASIQLSEKAPEGKTSSYAEEGTKAHELLEAFLKSKNPRVLRSKFIEEHGAEMTNHAFSAYKEIVEVRKTPGAELLCETKVDLTFVAPDMFGTVDAAIVDEFGRLTVIDFKYGAGIPVDPEDNEQMLYYALGIAHLYSYNFTDVALVIIQPRAEHVRGPVREWALSIEELKSWADKFKEGVGRCEDPLAGFNAGDHCRFCPAAVICPEISRTALETAQVDFADEGADGIAVYAPKKELIAPGQLGPALKAFEQLEFWMSEVRAYAKAKLERGEKIPGWKLVQKRSTRKWNALNKVEDEAIEEFGDKAFITELLSPAQLEKIAGKDWVERRCSAVSSGVTMAQESDKRPAVNPIEEDFLSNEDIKAMIFTPTKDTMLGKALATAKKSQRKTKSSRKGKTNVKRNKNRR